jgi:integrase
MIARLIFAGLRISELCQLRWRDVELDSLADIEREMRGMRRLIEARDGS